MQTVGEKTKHKANKSLTTAFDSVEHSCTILKPQMILAPPLPDSAVVFLKALSLVHFSAASQAGHSCP